jgi:hypothetical protein
MTLNKQGLEAAHARLEELSGMRNIPSILTRSGREFIAEKAIAAYLAALPAPDGLVERLLKLASTADGSSSGAKEALREAATVIQTQAEKIDRLWGAILNERQATARAVSRAEAAEQQVRDMEGEVRRLTTVAADRAYFMEAYRSMLGTIGLKVAKMWDEKRVKRVHHSWGPDAFSMTGEERAQLILDWEEAALTAVPVEFVDTPPDARLLLKDGGEC